MQLGVSLGIPSTLGKVAAAFSPLDLSPVLWLDAADTSTITEVSGSVSQWDNKGSLGNFTQGTAASQPTTGVTTQNGKNVIDFAADFMTSADAASAWKFLIDGSEYAVFVVAKPGTTANPNTNLPFLGTATIAPGYDSFGFSYEDRSSFSLNDRLRHDVTSAALDLVRNGQNDTITANTFHLVTLIADIDNATAADRSRMFVDGGTVIANNIATNSPTAADPDSTLEVGKASVSIFTGSMCEIVIVDGALTAGEIAATEAYLAAKWGITL